MSTRVVAHLLEADAEIPNNPSCALLVYPEVVDLSGPDPAACFERLFEGNHWTGSWRDGIFAFHHFHSTAHEVLGIYSGSATVQLGGERGVVLTVNAGDVVIIPAGVGHKKLDSRGALGVVGAYPRGQRPDMCRGSERKLADVESRVGRVPLPERDPVFGEDGPLFSHWRG